MRLLSRPWQMALDASNTKYVFLIRDYTYCNTTADHCNNALGLKSQRRFPRLRSTLLFVLIYLTPTPQFNYSKGGFILQLNFQLLLLYICVYFLYRTNCYCLYKDNNLIIKSMIFGLNIVIIK